jgi:predicted Holliday junction resolvase-like endonuclease
VKNSWIICLFILMVSAFAKAQSLQDLIPQVEQRPRQITDTLDRKYDERAVEARELAGDLKERYSGEEFNYQETTEDVQNIFDDFFDWLFRGLGKIFGIQVSPLWAIIIKWTVYAIIFCVAVFFLIKLLYNEKASRLTSRRAIPKNQIKVEDTHIEEIDLNKYIQDAIAAGNYRSAVRFLYLNSLKKLSSAGKIQWDFQKTNGDYYREIKDTDVKAHFQKVSYLYDHIWYGDFAISQVEFEKARLVFDQLNKRAA